MQVLQGYAGMQEPLVQWIAAGYSGAISSGHTTCGALYAGTAFLSMFYGEAAPSAPEPGNVQRSAAIQAVQALYDGFVQNFGATDCQTLTGYDLSQAGPRQEFLQAFRQVNLDHGCSQQIRYVLRYCLAAACERDPRKDDRP